MPVPPINSSTACYPAVWVVVALAGFQLADAASTEDNEHPQLDRQWKRNGLATATFEINGTGARNNPLRRPLAQRFTGAVCYFRYRIRYDAHTIDAPPAGDGEFFVFWLDDREGDDASTHSGGVPNVGIHVDGDRNRFMARYSPSGQKFATPLVGDRAYLVVGRLSKSVPGQDQPFDRLDLWVDPDAQELSHPQLTTFSKQAVSSISWIGFSTGAKTEYEDRITVWDVDVSASWEGILDLEEPVTAAAAPVTRRTVDFGRQVLPILKQYCFDCHAGADAEQGIRLDNLDDVLNRTAPRNADHSRLIQLVADGEMPPDGRLPEKQLGVLRAWINEGLDWDHKLAPTPVPQTEHWAFQRIQRPAIPQVNNRSWVRTPVDAFIARRHEELGLHAAPPADQNTLDRRVSLDLLGLPPESSGIDQPSSHVEQLLTLPAYGERWGRHWLDIARWAESNGHQHNRDRKHAWRYRDWVVNAFQANKPYDDFVREQVAGDELTPPRDAHLIATGFLAAARYSGNELDKEIQRSDILADVTNTTAAAFLGLTFECAQCHSHKFDPVSLRDYYRFQAFFANGQPANILLASQSAELASSVAERWRIYESVRGRLVTARRRQGIANPIVIPKTVQAAIKGAQRDRFDQLDRQIEQAPQAWAWQSATSSHSHAVAPHDMRFPLPRDPEVLAGIKTYLLIRGDVKSPGPAVQPGWPAVFGASAAAKERPRTALAQWLTSPDNPLTARVWVNRIWQWHFGRGLVETSSDLGSQGTPPSHPELLDYLASELVDHDWNTNHIHQLILNSSTYRQSSQYAPDNARIDPENRNYWRWTPRRLEAEAIRDTVLAVSGQLDTTRGGPSVAGAAPRRSLYLRHRRNGLPSFQQLFDGTDGNLGCARRRISTTSLQPLWLLNSEFMQQAAHCLAKRSGTTERAFRLALHREPDDEEQALLQQLAQAQGLASACLALLNCSEFMYLK